MNDTGWMKLRPVERKAMLAMALEQQVDEILEDEEHENEDRLAITYRIADEARAVEASSFHYTIRELVYESDLSDKELKELLEDLTAARRIIDQGRASE
jgi:hypothetical protein